MHSMKYQTPVKAKVKDERVIIQGHGLDKHGQLYFIGHPVDDVFSYEYDVNEVIFLDPCSCESGLKADQIDDQFTKPLCESCAQSALACISADMQMLQNAI